MYVEENYEEGVDLANQHQSFPTKDIQTSLEACQQPDYFVPEDTFPTFPDWSEALFAVCNIIVIIFSICGNIGALLVLYKSQVAKRSTKVYLASLAVCDLTLTITSPTVDLSQLLSRYRSWVFGGFLCNVIPFVQTACVVGVALFLVVIAAERYLYVVRSFEQPSFTAKWNGSPALTVVLIWVLSVGIAVPNLWYFEEHSFWTYIIIDDQQVRPRNETCKTYYICLRTDFDVKNIAYYSVLGIAALIPTVCFTFCYVSIILFVRKHVDVISASSTGTGGRPSRIARNRRTLRLILCLILLNLLCRVPVWIYAVYTNLKETPVTTVTLFLFYGFHLLSNVNSLLNPFMYAIFNDSIRSTRSTNGGTANMQKESGCWHYLTSHCYNNIKASSVDYFLERSSKKNYDFTKNNSKITSISTKKFNVSDKDEFMTPKNSAMSNVNTTNYVDRH